MNRYLIIILGMTLVTYLPRMFPLLLFANLDLSPFLKRFLHYIPPAALSALIFPGILQATESAATAIWGAFIALLLAYFNFNLLVVVMSSIIGVFLWQLIIVL